MKVEFIGGPFDGKISDETAEVLRFYVHPGIPAFRRTMLEVTLLHYHIYKRSGRGRFVYEGVMQ